MYKYMIKNATGKTFLSNPQYFPLAGAIRIPNFLDAGKLHVLHAQVTRSSHRPGTTFLEAYNFNDVPRLREANNTHLSMHTGTFGAIRVHPLESRVGLACV